MPWPKAEHGNRLRHESGGTGFPRQEHQGKLFQDQVGGIVGRFPDWLGWPFGIEFLP